MTERPILFNGPMVKAILEGRKTQTRRVMNPQPELVPADYPGPHPGGHWWRSSAHRSMLHVEEELQNKAGGWGGLAASACPLGGRHDRLWVRETWKPVAAQSGGMLVRYSADGASELFNDVAVPRAWKMPQVASRGFVPSIHMPRWACRLLLDIIDVRVERLQAISEEDAKAEGCAPVELDRSDDCGNGWTDYWYHGGFADLWRSVYGPTSWSANPWVWVISFRRAW